MDEIEFYQTVQAEQEYLEMHNDADEVISE